MSYLFKGKTGSKTLVPKRDSNGTCTFGEESGGSYTKSKLSIDGGYWYLSVKNYDEEDEYSSFYARISKESPVGQWNVENDEIGNVTIK